MPDKTQTELEKLEQDIQNGKYRYSSPRFIAMQIIQEGIRESLLHIGRIETTTDLTLVHYTSLSTVIAMLKAASEEKGYLRMYSAGGFNDPTEGEYFTDLAKKEPYLKLFLDEKEREEHAFVASFIQATDTDKIEDHFLFWHTYGRQCTGCSLKLKLNPSTVEEMRKVTYGPDDTTKSIQTIDEKLHQISNMVDKIIQITMNKSLTREDLLLHPKNIDQVRKEIEKTRYLYKRSAYQHEKECRLIETPETVKEKGIETKFDYSVSETEGMEVIKKYIEHPSLKLTDQFLRSGTKITLGPRLPNPVHTKEYIEKLLREAKIFGAKVKFSEIPYRKPFHH